MQLPKNPIANGQYSIQMRSPKEMLSRQTVGKTKSDKRQPGKKQNLYPTQVTVVFQ
jgi:hypothetical protein